MKTSYNHTQLRLFLNVITITVLVLLLTQGCTQTVLDSNEAQQLRQFFKWKHSGTIYIITTPEGADLPASAVEMNFPVLVRLHKDFFDFSQAKPGGEDIRFASNDGMPLPYQIEEWDAAGGTASIWVRIPKIKGNARQAINMHWGKSDAAGESNGTAVFNASNGFLSVFHLSDPVKDEVGTLSATDSGTTASVGMIGGGRHFAGGQGIKGGENITGYPTGSSPHSSEVWFRAERPNATILGWGNEQAQGKVVMQYRSPPHIHIDAYFSNGNVSGGSSLTMGQWVHVANIYKNGDARIYVNGKLDGVNTSKGSPLNIQNPARMWIGGWYNNYNFVGDIDEVRISNVARSADWIRLQYENQKPLQTLAGLLVPAGSDFSVSQAQISVLEGKSAALTASAGGAQKIYWVLKDGDEEEIYAVDRFNLSFDAGRVVGDKSLTLQFKAIYENEIKTKDIAVLIKEDIPEPIFTLAAPAKWDGRETIEIAPEITNLDQMQAKDAGELNYNWDVSGLAVIKEIEPGKLTFKRSQNSGKLAVKLAIDNGGTATIQTATMMVNEPKDDPWVKRQPGDYEKPEHNQFYARDNNNEGTLYYNGLLDAEEVYLKVYADDKLYKEEKQKLGLAKQYAFTVKLKGGLIKYRTEFGTISEGRETLLDTATNLVCGDAYIIQGQSNAEAWADQVHHPYQSEWLRSFGTPITHPVMARQKIWGNAVSFNGGKGLHKLQIGYWGVELAKELIEKHQVPIFIINGAQGGTRVDQHQRNPKDPTDVKTIYGRLLWRLQQARLTHGIRGVLWHQGENDQGAAGPTGRYGWETYQQYFVDMSASWKQDYPNIQHYYIFQIWPKSCAMGENGSDNMLREVQRTLPALYSNMSIMSTLGIKPPGTCHYPPEGYAVMAHLICPLVERDNYGKVFEHPITPANLEKAYYTSAEQDEIALEFDQNMVWTNSLTSEFYLDGLANRVASGAVSGNIIILKLKEASSSQRITYLDSKSWSQDRLLYGENGIAALTFCDVPIQSRVKSTTKRPY